MNEFEIEMFKSNVAHDSQLNVHFHCCASRHGVGLNNQSPVTMPMAVSKQARAYRARSTLAYSPRLFCFMPAKQIFQ